MVLLLLPLSLAMDGSEFDHSGGSGGGSGLAAVAAVAGAVVDDVYTLHLQGDQG